MLERPILQGFSVKLVHDLDSYSVHSSAQMLDNVEAVKNNLRLWKELLSEPIIRAVHVHGDDLDQLPNLSLIALEMVSNHRMSSPV